MDKTYINIINERIQQYGVMNLTDDEALSILTGIPICEVKNSIQEYGLAELIKFTSSLGLTRTQRKKLELLYHLVKRIGVSAFKEKVVLNASSKAGEYFVKELQFLKNEVFAIALLDAQSRLIKTETLFKGTLNEAHVYPREIIKLVLDFNASSVILAHNHPGGSQEASTADIDVTRKIGDALKTISVTLMDHIIVAEDRFTSLAERGLI